MPSTQYLTTDTATGIVTGAGSTPDGTIPEGAIICTADEASAWLGCTVVNGVIVPPKTPYMPPISAQAVQAMTAGLTIVSISTPSLNGTYGVTTTDQISLMGELNSMILNSTFTDGTQSLQYVDLNGIGHSFSIANFKAFATACGAYIGALKYIAGTNAGTLPSSTVTIP